MDGIITRRNIEEGENVVVGTMNNAGTVLLTVADMSAIQAEIEVDETDIPNVHDRPGGRRHDRCGARPDVQGARDRDRQQPDPGGGADQRHRAAAGDELQGRRHDRRAGARRAPRLHVHRGDHDGDAEERRGGAHSGADRARDAVRPEGHARARAAAARAAPAFRARRAATPAAPPEPPPGQTRKETEGVFVVRDGRVVFAAGEGRASPASGTSRSLSGLKAGDQVITGPFELGPRARRTVRAVNGEPATLEPCSCWNRSALALQIIWANKLRSLMTVLGNIVAVTSIVTVVSLIQGMNAMVSNAIVTEVGADAFTIQRLPHHSHGRRQRARAARTRCSRSTRRTPSAASARRIGSVMAQAQQRRQRSPTATQVLDAVEIQGVTSDYLDFATFNAERGRMMSADRGRAQPARGDARHRRRRTACSATSNPLDKTIQIAGRALPRRRRQREEGRLLRQLAGRFAVIPLGAYQKLFGARQSLSLLGQAGDAGAAADRDGRRHGGAARGAPPEARRTQTTSASSRPTRCSTSITRRPTASSPCSSAWSRSRSSSAASSS